jgi:hypothetical protein
MKTVSSTQDIIIQLFLTATISLTRRARFASVYIVQGHGATTAVALNKLRPQVPQLLQSLHSFFVAAALPSQRSYGAERFDHSMISRPYPTNWNFNCALHRSLLSLTRNFSELFTRFLQTLFSGFRPYDTPLSGMCAKALCLDEESNCYSLIRKTNPDSLN